MTLFRTKVARQQVLLESLTQKLGNVPNIEPAHQVETMDFDRPDADIQRRADLTIGMAQRDQSKDLALAWRNVQRRLGTMPHTVERRCGDAFVSCHLYSFQKA